MAADPLVSVVIPAYNAAKTIRNAIDSVLGQTMSDLEVIVVDDASTDDTVHAVEVLDDPHVRLLRSHRNSRPSAARNLGLRHARGRWVAFIDGDDEWVPTRLEHLLRAAADKTDCFVADWSALCLPDAKGHLVPLELPNLPGQSLVERFNFIDYLEWGINVSPIVPRLLLTRHDIEFPDWGSGGEWAFLIARLSASGVRGKLLHRVGYLYRVTGAHDSSRLRAIEEQLKVTEFLATDRGVPEAAKERLRQQAPGIRRRLVVAALREHKWRKFVFYARQNPGDLAWLPTSVLRFLSRRVRYLGASRSSRAAL